MIPITVFLHEDQLRRVRQLTKIVGASIRVESDDSLVIRGIIEAYFRLCDQKGSAVSPPDQLSQEGLGGETLRVAQLKKPVRCSGKTWEQGTSVDLLQLFSVPIERVVGRHASSNFVKMARLRFPDGNVGDVRAEVLVPNS